MSGTAGAETAKFGAWLRAHLKAQEGEPRRVLFYDHGDPATDPQVAAIKGIVGQAVSNVSNKNRLADIDLLLAAQGEADLLLEIEERPLSPKKLLGDIFTLLMCNRVAVRHGGTQHYFTITPHTRLLVVGVVSAQGQQQAKVEEVILPRLNDFTSPADSIPRHNVKVMLGDTLEDAIAKLKDYMLEFIG